MCLYRRKIDAKAHIDTEKIVGIHSDTIVIG